MNADGQRARATTVKSGLELEALGAPIEVRRHPAARRLTLRVSKTKRAVIVTVPAQCRMEEAGKFLKSNSTGCASGWAACRSRCPSPTARGFPCAGDLHRVCFTGPRRARAVVEIDAARRQDMPRLLVSGRSEHAPRRLQGLAGRAGPLRSRRRCVTLHAKSLGVKARSITPARSDQPLGLVHGRRAAVVLVAADPGAGPCARLRGRARGRASRRDEPRARASGSWWRARCRGWRRPSAGCAITAPTCTATALRPEQDRSMIEALGFDHGT